MGNKPSSSGSQPNIDVRAVADQAWTNAILQEMQADKDKQEVLERISRLEEENTRTRRLLEEEKKKNENSSTTNASPNSPAGSGLSPVQTAVPGPQGMQSYHGQPIIQSTPATSGQHVGQVTGQPNMGHQVGGPMMGPHQGGPMMGLQQTGQMMGPQPTGQMMGPQQTGQMMGSQQGGPMMGPQQTGQMMGSQQGGPTMGPHQGGPGQTVMGTPGQQPSPYGQPMMGTQPGGQMGQSMMGPIGQPMMGSHPLQMSHSMGPQQFSLHPSGPMGPHHGYSPQQGPMGHPDFNPQFQPPIGRMGPQMPPNRGGFPHPYRRGPQHKSAQNNDFQNNHGGSNQNQNQNQNNRRNIPSKEQPRARSSSREKNGPQNRTNNPYRQNKPDASNRKPTANQGAIPKQKPPQPNPTTKKQPKNDSGSEKSLPAKNNCRKKTTKLEQNSDNSSEKSQEKGVPKTKKEKNPLFSNKAPKTAQKVDDYLKSMKTQKPGGSEEKVVLNFEELANLNSKNPELWDINSLAKLFGKDDVTSKQPNSTSRGPPKPVPISDLAKMFEPDEDSKTVHEPKLPKPRPDLGTGPQNSQKKNPAPKKFSTNDLQNILEKMNLLSANESKTAIDLKEMMAKIKLPANTEQKNLKPNLCPDLRTGNHLLNSDAGTKILTTKEQVQQHKKNVMQTSDDSDDSADDSSDSDFSSVSKDSFKTAVGAKQPLADREGTTRKPFMQHLTPAELPPLSKAYAGKRGYLNFFVGKKIPSKKEAREMGVKTAQLYRRVQGVLVFDARSHSFDFPKTVMDIVEFGEKHPDAEAAFTSDFLKDGRLQNYKFE